MSSVINRTFLLMVFYIMMPLYGVNIVIKNDPLGSASNHKVWIQFKMEPGELGIFKNTLQFSVDHPEVSLVAWNTSTVPTDYFSSSRKKTLELYSQDFIGCLLLEHKHPGQLKHSELLAHTKLYVSCFVMRSNGKTKPLGRMLALGTSQALATEIKSDTHASFVGNVYQLPTPLPVPNLAQEFEPIEHLGVLWALFCRNLVTTVFGKAFLWWYIVVAVLFCAYFLKRRFGWLRFIAPFQGAVAREIMVLLAFLLATGSLYLAHFMVATMYVLYAFAGLCSIAMLYVLLTPAREELFLGRLKSLIGLVLGSMILPVMLKAYLMQQGL